MASAPMSTSPSASANAAASATASCFLSASMYPLTSTIEHISPSQSDGHDKINGDGDCKDVDSISVAVPTSPSASIPLAGLPADDQIETHASASASVDAAGADTVATTGTRPSCIIIACMKWVGKSKIHQAVETAVGNHVDVFVYNDFEALQLALLETGSAGKRVVLVAFDPPSYTAYAHHGFLTHTHALIHSIAEISLRNAAVETAATVRSAFQQLKTGLFEYNACADMLRTLRRFAEELPHVVVIPARHDFDSLVPSRTPLLDLQHIRSAVGLPALDSKCARLTSTSVCADAPAPAPALVESSAHAYDCACCQYQK